MKTQLLALMFLLLPLGFALQADILATSPSPVVAGEYADITFRLSSVSDQQVYSDISLSVDSSPFISPVSSPLEYASIRPGDQITSTHRVYIDPSTPQGFINMNFLLASSQSEIQFQEEVFISSKQTPASLRVGQIRSIPNQLVADSNQNQLQITLQNLGEQDAELVSAQLVVPQGISESYSYSLLQSTSRIGAGSEQTLNFYIDIDAGIRESVDASIVVDYRTRLDSTRAPTEESVVLPVQISLAKTPFLEVVNTELLTSSQQGTNDNELRVTIQNTGNEEALDARVRLFPDISFPLIFERTSLYVGASIAPGQNRSFTINYEVLQDASIRDYEVSVELESLVGTSRYTQQDAVAISVSEGSSFTAQNAAWLIIGVVAILALAIGFSQVRSKKSSK